MLEIKACLAEDTGGVGKGVFGNVAPHVCGNAQVVRVRNNYRSLRRGDERRLVGAHQIAINESGGDK